MKGERRPGGQGGSGKGQEARPERPASHRPSALQLEEFRKRVNPDVLKDAKMSKEDFERFLKDYADLAKRQQAAGPDRDTAPAPGRAGGAGLPSIGGRAVKPAGAGKPDDTRSEGTPKPPPEYREAQRLFTGGRPKQ